MTKKPLSKANKSDMKIVPDERDHDVSLIDQENIVLSQKAFVDVEKTEEVGELALDVFHNDEEIVIIAPIAGVRSQDLSLNVTKGILTIRGRRIFNFNGSPHEYVTRECFWGLFSRNVILPEHVDLSKIKASFKNGLLSIRIPKTKPVEVKVVEVEDN